VWITGVGGFTGVHLVNFLRGMTDKPRMVGLDVLEKSPAGIDDYTRVDLNEIANVTLLARAAHPDYVIHLAGAMPPAGEAAMWHANVGGTLGLLQGLAEAGCQEDTRIVTIGSAAEYQPSTACPLTETSPCGGSSPYGRTKWAQSVLALTIGRQTGLSVMVARPFNLIGPGLSTDLVAGWLCEQFRAGAKEIEIGNLDSARDFVDIRDAVVAYWLVAEKGVAGEIYNVCTGTAISVNQLVALACQLTQTNPTIRVDAKRVRASDWSVCYGDSSKIEQTTGWRPHYRLKDSVTAMLHA
jgi:GDP-4-dehydro-6-deoxy-D-mannose reductase